MRSEGAEWRRDGRLRRSVLRFQLRNEWRRMLQHWRASVARAQHAAQVRAGALIQGIAKQMRLDAFQADVRRQQQQAAVRRWRSAGVRDRWQRMRGGSRACTRCASDDACNAGVKGLRRFPCGKQAEAWRQWRAEAQHRAASRRIKERTRRVHTAFKAHGGSALHPPSFEQQYPWTEWARQRRQRLEGALSRGGTAARGTAEPPRARRGARLGRPAAGPRPRTSAHRAARAP